MTSVSGRGARAGIPAQKLRVPTLPSATVPRRRDALRRPDPDARVIDICAPAGSGKTTLMAAWARELIAAGAHVGWVALDESDSSVFHVWSAILEALDGLRIDELSRLSPPTGGVDPGFVTAFAHALDSAAQPVWLFLDDVHELAGGGLDALAGLLRRLPDDLRIVLGARFDTGLPLAKLRMSGALREVTAADLAFQGEEARTMLEAYPDQLSPGDVELLVRSTEGWAAGLRVAAMAFQNDVDPRAVVASFATVPREMGAYFADEIGAHLAPDVAKFLREISVAERVNSELATALSGRADAGRVLERLDAANVLIVRLGTTNEWYRLHALLRSWLVDELGRQDSAALAAQHRLAADWYDIQGRYEDSIAHRILAADWAPLAARIRTDGLNLLLSGSSELVQRAGAALTAADHAAADIWLIEAIAWLNVSDVARADVLLRRIDGAWHEHEDERLRALHLCVLMFRARIKPTGSADLRSLIDAATTVSSARVIDPDLEMLLLANRGTLCIQLGEWTQADTDLRRALDLATVRGRDALVLHCLSYLAGTAGGLGNLHEMPAIAAQALEFGRQRGWGDSPLLAAAHLIAAWSHFLVGADDEARYHADRARTGAVARTIDPDAEVGALAIWQIVHFAGAPDPRAPLRELRALWSAHADTPLSPQLVSYAAVYELAQALIVGERDWAADTAARARQRLGQCADVIVFEALVDADAGRAAAARRALTSVLTPETSWQTPTSAIAAWALEATLADQAGESARTRVALIAALETAAPLFAVRQFEFAPARVRQLLTEYEGRLTGVEAFAAQVREALAAHRPIPAPTELGLTLSELAVLRELPSLLTTADIARARHVSLNTIKTQQRSIYRKLGAANRREAVAIARNRGVL